MNQRMSHIVIVRMHYPRGDPKFEWRFDYFKLMVLPRLLNHTFQDFDIGIRCNPVHYRRFLELSPKIIPFTVTKEAEGYIRPEDRERAKPYGGEYFIDFVEWKDVVGLEKYDIQTGLDSDDLILRDDYLEFIQKKCHHAHRNSLHLSFIPYCFNLESLALHHSATKYTPTHASPFMSLYQPSKDDNFKFVYHDSHYKMGQYAQKSITVPEGYVAFTVHHHNESSNMWMAGRKLP